MSFAFALLDPVVDMAGRVDSIWLSTLRSIRPKRATDIESNCHHSDLQLTPSRVAGAMAPGGFMLYYLISGRGFARTNQQPQDGFSTRFWRVRKTTKA
jgi:hypothetical protein